MGVLATKLLLAPTFVVAASLAARRFGATIGGLVGGLPVVAGPILLVFALDHGPVFAAGAAAGTLLGLVSLLAFIVVYAHLASHVRWWASLVLGWGAFFAVTAALSTITVDADTALAVVLVAIALTMLVLPQPRGERAGSVRLPSWDLPLRALSALALVCGVDGGGRSAGGEIERPAGAVPGDHERARGVHARPAR